MVVPDDMPVTTPEVLTVPINGSLLLHVPPAGLHVNDVVCPAHITIPPVITPGNGLTVTTTVDRQPVGNM
jgi:hypothetical protein